MTKKNDTPASNILKASGPAVNITKKDKNRYLRVTVYPEGGHSPYETDVEPDGESTFQIGEGTYVITRGSVVRGLDGIMRTIVYEGNASTISALSFAEDPVMHPLVANSLVHNNLVRQFNDIQKERSMWRQGSTWAFISIGIVGIIMLLWMARSIGGGFEQLSEDIRNLIEAWQQNQPRTGGTSPDTAGHNTIAPNRSPTSSPSQSTFSTEGG